MRKIIIYIQFLLLISLTATCQTKSSKNADYQTIVVDEFAKKLQETSNAQLLDVRTEGEFAEKHLANALNINYNGGNFKEAIAKLDKTKPTFVYCLSGGRSSAAAAILQSAGFTQVYNLKGGIAAWQQAGQALAPQKSEEKTEKSMSLADFEAKVNSDKYVLVDFNAVWCAPCKKLKPILEEIAEEQKDKLILLEVDVDKNEEVANSLKIQEIPRIFLYKNGKKVWEHLGLLDKAEILKALK